jgi:uncharacterized protein (TIGR02300 family)
MLAIANLAAYLGVLKPIMVPKAFDTPVWLWQARRTQYPCDKRTTMPKEEWGVKRVCPSCAVRFYDLQNNPMTCPSCEHEFTLESLTGNKSRTMTADKPDAQNKDNVADSDEDDVVLDDDEDDDADVDLGDDVLEDDDDDTVSLAELAAVESEDKDDS